MGVQNIEYCLVRKKGLWRIGWYTINMHPEKFLGVLQAWVRLMFQCAFLWQVNKSNMRLGLLYLVITLMCLFHINEGKYGIFVLLYDGEVGESKYGFRESELGGQHGITRD